MKPERLEAEEAEVLQTLRSKPALWSGKDVRLEA
jgi:hypothetical protein